MIWNEKWHAWARSGVECERLSFELRLGSSFNLSEPIRKVEEGISAFRRDSSRL